MNMSSLVFEEGNSRVTILLLIVNSPFSWLLFNTSYASAKPSPHYHIVDIERFGMILLRDAFHCSTLSRQLGSSFLHPTVIQNNRGMRYVHGLLIYGAFLRYDIWMEVLLPMLIHSTKDMEWHQISFFPSGVAVLLSNRGKFHSLGMGLIQSNS